MTKMVLVPVADGSEDLEAVTLIDVLRRAGAEVVVASVKASELQICAARGTRIIADKLIGDCANTAWDLIALPGGIPGAENLAADATLSQLLEKQQAEKRLIGAICAAPAQVLGVKGMLDGRKATCHPNFHKTISCGEVDVEARVVVDGHIVTSQGPGTALDFALALVEQLCGVVKREEVAAPMVLTTSTEAFY